MTFDEVHRSIKRGDAIQLRKALADGLDPNLANPFGATILMLAALKGNSLVGELLIEHGADMELRDKHDDTALRLAAFGTASFFRMLLAKGASLEADAHGMSLDTYLEWVQGFYPESAKKMQQALERERRCRAQRDQMIEMLSSSLDQGE